MAAQLAPFATVELTPYFLKKATKAGVAPQNWIFDYRIDWESEQITR